MSNVFDVALCTKDVIAVLEKHNATFWNMKEVFKNTENEVLLKTHIHTDDSNRKRVEKEVGLNPFNC